jgi:TetR/AcrR family transcriptional regulator, transcriptional repressor for nem operon
MNKRPTPADTADRQCERGRPREFDIGEVTSSAAQLFWEQGYHATSIESLCNATGLLRGSLYGAFGDKHGLLVAAFQHYSDGAIARLKNRLEADLPPREALRQNLLHYTRVATQLAERHGCFITNTAIELMPNDDVLRPYVETTLRRIAALLAASVVRGQKAGVFDATLDEKSVGNFLLCLVQGIRVLNKVDMAEPELAAIVETAMRVLG